MPADPSLSKKLFDEALQRPQQERPAFLDVVCGPDTDLRARVESLLRALSAADDFLVEAPVPATHGTERSGMVIDRYKLLEVIGEGGFGTVWMAEQQEPVRRKVALKVIKLGMDTRQVVARFEAERQALALMDHPNIARVLDGGATSLGRPFFVMELVRGVAITEYCDQAELDARERLALFQVVCQAVQHAHQKGVIHRDLKPNNILVTLHDGVPVPKVIDFGVAKATSAELTQRTLFTEFRQIVGTPEYMAPEQAEMSGLDVDTRADVYSLGVLLYELLTGTRPFDAQTIREQGYAEMMRIIREDEPQKPSMRISTLGDGLAAMARRRQASPDSLWRSIRGDLDWIVMKALEKDRGRRFPTAIDLAADIGRYLRDEPVHATPPSMGYRLRKSVRRNRVLVSTGIAVVLALLGGLSVAVWGWLDADEQRRRAVIAERAAGAERDDANAQRQRAELAQRSAESATRFFTETIGLANPDVSDSLATTSRSLLEAASAKVGDAFEGMPEAEAEVRTVIGEAFLALGESATGGEHLLRAIQLWRDIEGAWPHKMYRALWACRVARAEQRSNRWLDWSYIPAAKEIIAAGDTVLAQALHAVVHFGEKKPFLRLGDRMAIERLMSVATDRLPPSGANETAGRRWTVLADLLVAASKGPGFEIALDVYEKIGIESTNTRVVHARLKFIDHLLEDEVNLYSDAIREARATLATIRKFDVPEDHWYVARCNLRLGRALVRRAMTASRATTEAKKSQLLEALDCLRAGLGVVETELLTGASAKPRILAAMIHALEGVSRVREANALRGELAEAIGMSREGTQHWVLAACFGPGDEKFVTALRDLREVMNSPGDAEQRFLRVLHAAERLDPQERRTAAVAKVLTQLAGRLVNQTDRDFLREGILPAFQFGERVLTAPEYRYHRGQAIWRAADIEAHLGDNDRGEAGLRRSMEFLDPTGFAEPVPGQRPFREIMIARCMFRRGERDRACELASRAFREIRSIRGDNNLDVNNCFHYWVQMLVRTDSRAAAIRVCRERLERLRDGEACHMGMKGTLAAMTNILGADEEVREGAGVLMERFPLHAGSYVWGARCAAIRFDRTKFDTFARRALQLGHDDPGVHTALAWMYARLGRKDRAGELLTSAIQLRRTSQRSMSLANLEERFATTLPSPEAVVVGSVGAAADKVAAEVDERSRPVSDREWRRYGALLARAGRFDEARERLAGLTEVWPGEPYAWAARAWVLATAEGGKAQDRTQAVRCAEKAVALSGRQGPVMLAALAEARFRLGERNTAITTARQALQLLAGSDAEWLSVAEMERRLASYRE